MMYKKIGLALLLALGLSGCQSSIKKYDTTFTSQVSEKDTKKFISDSKKSKNVSFYNKKSKSAKDSIAKTKSKKVAKPYFVEFRARNAQTYGHVAVVFGKLNNKGGLPLLKGGVLDPKKVQITGLHPATTSSVPWSVGHLVPVPAETGPSDGDFEEKYVLARYRVNLTKTEFRKLVRVVAKHKAQNKLWYAPNFMANCLGYLSSIAKDMGMEVPKTAKLPKKYIQELKRINS